MTCRDYMDDNWSDPKDSVSDEDKVVIKLRAVLI